MCVLRLNQTKLYYFLNILCWVVSIPFRLELLLLDLTAISTTTRFSELSFLSFLYRFLCRIISNNEITLFRICSEYSIYLTTHIVLLSLLEVLIIYPFWLSHDKILPLLEDLIQTRITVCTYKPCIQDKTRGKVKGIINVQASYVAHSPVCINIIWPVDIISLTCFL